ncbi:MAG: hypothetical protein R3264_02385, partial [Anaerolineae bacterium]|nr:hypothetical protein [Anaerolineae bacterium]
MMGSSPAENVLFGVVCLDVYTQTGQIRPGCGILHNAYHLQRLGAEPLLITRIGDRRHTVFLDFFAAHDLTVLPDSLIKPGRSASIHIVVQPTGEAVISGFDLGVWADFQLTAAEATWLTGASNIHTVLVQGFLDDFLQAGRNGYLSNAFVSADFLSFRNFTLDSFAELLPYLDLGFLGWKGDRTDPILAEIKRAVRQHPILFVITLGDRGIIVFDAREPGNFQEQFFPVEKVAVQGNTNGCGDAFIAYFIAEYWRTRNL